MKKVTSGQANISGINAQAWASMSLFLQFLRDPRFSYIHLEAPGFQDFNLVFSDGHKIICESKDRKEKFDYRHLKSILQNISKNSVIGGQDEILIICRNANDNLISDVERVKYFEQLKNKFIKKGYSETNIALLSKIKFWVVPSAFNEKVIYSLFADLVNFWLPSDEIEKIVDHILVQKIYKGSAKGSDYSRADILKEIDDLATQAKSNSVYYGDLDKREKQFKVLDNALKDPKHKTWMIKKELSAFSTDYERLKFATSRLANKKGLLNLKSWDPVWQLNRVYYFTYGIFDVFENNLYTDENRKYVLDYIKKYTKDVRGFYQIDFFDTSVVKIVTKIIKGADGKKYLNDAFAIVNNLITFNEKEFFYLKTTGYDHGQWEKEETCKLLHEIYFLAGDKLKQKIFDLLVTAFNITEDDGEFSHHSPKEVFAILSDWLNEDFIGRFEKIVKIIADQYDRYYKTFSKKIEFTGWEHMGGGVSFSGGYHAYDRHFVGILSPAISKFYEKDQNAGWNFIKDKCISSEKKVEKCRPDFLNRSVYQIVLDRYTVDDEKISKEAFEILSEFILSRRGIPHKTDLIYQSVVYSNKLSDEKKWKLVELTTKKYGIPVNPFAEQIVANLAKAGFQEARNELKKWFGEPKYYAGFRFGDDTVTTIKTLLDSDFDFALELLKTLLTSDYFKTGKSDRLSPFVVAELLHNTIKTDYGKGISILKLLTEEKELTNDQQSIFCYSLYNNQGNDDSDDVDLLMKIYTDIVDPFLNNLDNNITKIYKMIPSDGARSAIVQFSTRLATKKKMAEAVRIIRVFVDDPDPYLAGKDPNDPKDKYNENKRIEDGKEPNTIDSVRGWCGWALMKCSTLEGRDQIPEIIKLSKKLAFGEEKNYYVIHMACFSLAQLARNRLTVLPTNKDVLFFNNDKEKALKLAKEVESTAFSLLGKLLSWPEAVQKAMAKSILYVFDPIRALNEADSLRLVNALTRLPVEAMEESAPLFIYYAEFRKDACKDWKFSIPGLYDDLGPDKYDSNKFKKILIETIEKLQKEDPDNCFRFAASFEHMTHEVAVKDGEKDKYTKLAIEYFELLTGTYAHNIYNLIYRVIQDKLTKPDTCVDYWYTLFEKCLKNEKTFYEKEIKAGNASKVYWYPALYHSSILELISQNLGNDKFMNVAKIFFSFPKELELHESDNLVSIIKELAKTDKDAKTIIKYLKDKNPSKYWGLK